MAKKQNYMPNITIEDARIIFRNFAGKKQKFNAEGNRNFCVLLDDDVAATLKADGWNVKFLPAREEGETDQPYLQVRVRYDYRPPKIVLISENTRKKTYLDEEDVHIVDWAEIKTLDMIISPSEWEFNGKTGIKAYLKKMFITLVEDELELKYADDEPVDEYEDESF